MYKVTCSLMVKETVAADAARATKSSEVAEYCQDMAVLLQESVQVVMLNSKNKIIGREMISLGAMDASHVDPKILFRHILLRGARSFILVHNHPSGDPAPSSDDMKITQKIKDCSKILDVIMLDHVIIGDNGKYFSFADEGEV